MKEAAVVTAMLLLLVALAPVFVFTGAAFGFLVASGLLG